MRAGLSFRFLLGIALSATAVTTSAKVTLPTVFGSDMVLQRDIEVPVWGWADPGERVSVRVAGKQAQTTADTSGTWILKLPPIEAGGPHTMTVCGTNQIDLTNVLVGEVWLCSGQSNMDMGINQVQNGQTEREQANYSQIRLFEIPYKQAPEACRDCDAKWRECTSDTVGQGGFAGAGFSAVAYFFGRDIHKELGVPVGLIKASFGGTRIEPWTPPEGFELHPQYSDILTMVREATPKHRARMVQAMGEMESWLPQARRAADSGAAIPPPPAWPKHELDDIKKPTSLYNGMIYPIVPYAIRGALWYQGESNREDQLKYTDRMRALVDGWRKVWQSNDMPFYYVQIAPFHYYDPPEWTTALWEAQLKAMAIPHTGMVVTTDLVDNIQDIHPKLKQEVGARLARWALAKTYGRRDIIYSGPIYDSMKREGNAIRIKFRHADGLRSRDGGPLNWFAISGSDRKFEKAEAHIDGTDLLVSSPAVPEPVAVRFAWDQEAQPNFVNGANLPASPFRTDSW